MIKAEVIREETGTKHYHHVTFGLTKEATVRFTLTPVIKAKNNALESNGYTVSWVISEVANRPLTRIKTDGSFVG